MKTKKLLLILATLSAGGTASSQEMTELSCRDFRPTPEAIERFPNLAGACEGIVERDGELYGKFTATVRRVRGNNVTLHLPATDQTVSVRADPLLRVLIGDRKVRPRDLGRGDEIHIYLAVTEFSKPDIEDIVLVTEADILVNVEVDQVAAQIPGRVTTAAVTSVAIVEAVNRETREIKVIDASGQRFSFVAGDMVANFDQIEPRDRIVTEHLESVAVFVAPAGAPAMGDAMAVELAPLGNKPGVKAVDTFMVSATVEALNVTDRIAMIRGKNGNVRTIKIADDVPLDLVEVGDEVRLRITQAIAISVRKADKS